VNGRVWNFSAGPGALPVAVLRRARDELLGLPAVGASILEISHRSPAFESVISEAEANLRELLQIGDDHHVLFLQGGASLQFTMVPMNLLRSAGTPAAYVVTGSWGQKALAEARKEGEVTVAWDGSATSFTTVPELETLDIDRPAYVHVTSNETSGRQRSAWSSSRDTARSVAYEHRSTTRCRSRAPARCATSWKASAAPPDAGVRCTRSHRLRP
jgi:phosphoserine aminotransferase